MPSLGFHPTDKETDIQREVMKHVPGHSEAGLTLWPAWLQNLCSLAVPLPLSARYALQAAPPQGHS